MIYSRSFRYEVFIEQKFEGRSVTQLLKRRWQTVPRCSWCSVWQCSLLMWCAVFHRDDCCRIYRSDSVVRHCILQTKPWNITVPASAFL